MANTHRILYQGPVTVAKRPAGTTPPALGPTAPASTKGFVQVTADLVTIDNAADPAVLNVMIPAYDPSTTNALTELYAILFAPTATPPTDPDAAFSMAIASPPPPGVSVFAGGVAHLNGALASLVLAGLGNDQADTAYTLVLLGTDEVS